jgi:hypothetical protein
MPSNLANKIIVTRDGDALQIQIIRGLPEDVDAILDVEEAQYLADELRKALANPA